MSLQTKYESLFKSHAGAKVQAVIIGDNKVKIKAKGDDFFSAISLIMESGYDFDYAEDGVVINLEGHS